MFALTHSASGKAAALALWALLRSNDLPFTCSNSSTDSRISLLILLASKLMISSLIPRLAKKLNKKSHKLLILLMGAIVYNTEKSLL